MQLKLGFQDLLDPASPQWDELDPDARRAFLEALARVIAQAVRRPERPEPHPSKEDRNER